MWVDRPGVGLPIFPNPCFGPNAPGLCLGCYGRTRAGHGPHCSFGLASGILGPVLYPHQLEIDVYELFQIKNDKKNLISLLKRKKTNKEKVKRKKRLGFTSLQSIFFEYLS